MKTIPHRADFWKYCVMTANAVKNKSVKLNLPCTVDKYFIDELFINQGFRCAVSKIPFEPPQYRQDAARHPFGPSLDRIVPCIGYTQGNVRLVCTMVNLAMSNWGEENFLRLVRAMRTSAERNDATFETLHEKA